VFECFHALRRPFSQSLNPAILKIPYEANDLVPRRRPLRKEPVAYPLNVTTNEKPACNSGHLDYDPQSNTELDEVQCIARQRRNPFWFPSVPMKTDRSVVRF